MASKANRVLGLLRRNLYNCSQNVKQTAYFSLVRQLVENSAVVWDPYKQIHIDLLDKIQRNAARFVTKNNERSPGVVTKLISDLKWESLQQRRQDARLSLFYKMVYDLVDIPSDRYLTPVARPGLRHNNTLNYQLPLTRINAYKNSYFPRTIKEWNSLSEDKVQSNSIETFKARLSKTSN